MPNFVLDSAKVSNRPLYVSDEHILLIENRFKRSWTVEFGFTLQKNIPSALKTSDRKEWFLTVWLKKQEP